MGGGGWKVRGQGVSKKIDSGGGERQVLTLRQRKRKEEKTPLRRCSNLRMERTGVEVDRREK